MQPAALRHRPARLRRARPAVRRVARPRRRERRAGYAFVAGAVYYAIVCSWIWYFGTVAIVPFVAIASRATGRAPARSSAGSASRGVANPFLTAAVWVVADAVRRPVPVRRLLVGRARLRVPRHRARRARSRASAASTLVTFLAVALNAFLADLVARRPRAAVRARRTPGIAVIAARGRRRDGRPAPSPRVTQRLRVALIQGNDKNRDLTDAELNARYLPNSHFDLATRITDPVDLIVFPESSMDADPRTDPYIRDQLSAHRARAPRVGARERDRRRATRTGTQGDNLDVLFGPTVRSSARTRSGTSCRSASTCRSAASLEGWIPALDRGAARLRAGATRPASSTSPARRVATVICFESAFGYQVRPLVHDGAAGDHRLDQQPLVPALGELGPAPRDRSDARRRDGPAAGPSGDLGHHRRHRCRRRGPRRRRNCSIARCLETTVAATTGQTPYVRTANGCSWQRCALVVIARGRRVRPSAARAVRRIDRLDESRVDRLPHRRATRSNGNVPRRRTNTSSVETPRRMTENRAPHRAGGELTRVRDRSARGLSRSMSRPSVVGRSWSTGRADARSSRQRGAAARHAVHRAQHGPGRARVRPPEAARTKLGREAPAVDAAEAQPASAPAADPPARPAPPSVTPRRADGRQLPVGARPPTRRRSDELPIPGYDALSASQVVERLAGLDAERTRRRARVRSRAPAAAHDSRQDRTARRLTPVEAWQRRARPIEDLPAIVDLAARAARPSCAIDARRRALGAPRGAARTARRRASRRCSAATDARSGRRHDRRRRHRLRHGRASRRCATGRRLGVIAELFVDPEAPRRSVWARRSPSSSSRSARAAQCIGIDARALPGHRAAKNFFERDRLHGAGADHAQDACEPTARRLSRSAAIVVARAARSCWCSEAHDAGTRASGRFRAAGSSPAKRLRASGGARGRSRRRASRSTSASSRAGCERIGRRSIPLRRRSTSSRRPRRGRRAAHVAGDDASRQRGGCRSPKCRCSISSTGCSTSPAVGSLPGWP